jgi:hypothetical protein
MSPSTSGVGPILPSESRVLDLEAALVFVRNQLGDEGAPGHDHETPGRWDADGRRCTECAAWNLVWSLVSHMD